MFLTRFVGIALSHMNPKDLSLPLQLYRTAIQRALALPVAQRASPSFMEWTERALSHSALTAYRCWLENNSPAIPLPPATTCLITPRKHEKTRPDWKTDAEQAHPPTPGPSTPDLPSTPEIGTATSKPLADETTVASAFKGFHNFIADLPGQTQPTIATPSLGSYSQKDEERREVYRHYFRFLSTLLLPNHHPDSPSPRDVPSGSPTENGSNNTISIVHDPNTVPTLTAKAGTKSQLHAELKLIQTTYEAYLTHSLPFPSAADFHELIGEFVDVIALNWHTAGANGSDAEAVVEILYRAVAKTFHSPRILRYLFYTLTSVGNLADAVLALQTYLDLSENAKERILKGKIEKDFDPDGTVLATAVDGVRMICKYVGDGEKGLKIAKRIEHWVKQWRVADGEVLAYVYRGVGTANATWARQTVVGENREDLLRVAETAFLRGLEHDAKDADAWYGLALVQVDLLDVHAAVESLGKGLAALGAPSPSPKDEGYTRRATPLLHALSLLLSAREEYEAATAACSTALALLSSHADPTALSIEMKETALQLQMTLMALSEATLGPEMAVGMSEHLLSLYTRLFPPPLRAAQEMGPSPLPTTAVTLTRPGTATRISRMLTGRSARQHEKGYSVSAYDLPNGGLSCLPPRPGTGKLVRPNTGNKTIGTAGSQTMKARGKKEYTSLRIAPKIKASNTDPVVVDPMLPGIAPQPKKTRRFSVSGGTIRRNKSVKSSASSSTAAGEPTPPMPSTPGTSAGTLSFTVSRDRTPIGSAFSSPGGRDSPETLGEGVMFTVLKRKLDSHQATHRNGHFATPPLMTGGSQSPVDSIREEKVNGVGDSPPRKIDIPNNLQGGQLSYPLAALGGYTTEGVARSVKRPWTLPEPVVGVEDEKRRADIALRTVWLCVCGLYRRCGWIGDARGALEEAGTIGEGTGVWGVGAREGEADVCVERGLLALEAGDRRAAIELFETALATDVNHPGAVVALSQILLDIVPSSSSPVPPPQKIASDRPKLPTQLQTKEENEADFMIRQNRALGLLRACTNSPRGWDCSEAWYALADVLEKQGDVDDAKRALWKVVGLEDARGVRRLGTGVRIL